MTENGFVMILAALVALPLLSSPVDADDTPLVPGFGVSGCVLIACHEVRWYPYQHTVDETWAAFVSWVPDARVLGTFAVYEIDVPTWGPRQYNCFEPIGQDQVCLGRKVSEGQTLYADGVTGDGAVKVRIHNWWYRIRECTGLGGADACNEDIRVIPGIPGFTLRVSHLEFEMY